MLGERDVRVPVLQEDQITQKGEGKEGEGVEQCEEGSSTVGRIPAPK